MKSDAHPVRSGLDLLLDEGPSVAGLSRDARVALVAHPASVDRQAQHALERLPDIDGVRLIRLFAPEHGLWGHEQDMETVEDATDPVTGLPSVSLYGTDVTSLKPSAEALADLDAVLVDLQDVGSRYYTFIYTLAYVMEAAAEKGLPVIVLDRPNPIGGTRVEGPVLHPDHASFVGRFPLPVRHGMTPGELAGMFNAEQALGAELRVVRLDGWQRSMGFEQTGLPWVAPSPNMPTPGTARIYPGGCLIEGTNLSEGRGTTQPFELIGAPWIDAADLARRMRRRALPGALFRPASFRPMFQKHAGVGCGGVQLIVSDIETFEPFESYLALLSEIWQGGGDSAWRSETYEFVDDRPAIDLLLGRADLRPLIEAGRPAAEMRELWLDELSAFVERREPFLLY